MKANSLLMLSMAAAGMLACSGNDAKYHITGMNAPQDGITVYLVDRIIADDIDSSVIVDGTFEMMGKATKDAFLDIVVEGSDWHYPLINDGVPVQINFTDSSVTGSAQNVKLTECDKRNSKAYSRLNQLIDGFLALSKEEQDAVKDEFVAQYEAVFQQFADTKLAIIEENMDNLIPVAFIENVPEVLGYEKFNELVSSDAPFAKHPFVVDLKEGLENAMNEELKAEMPNVVAMYKQYHDKGFDIVGLSFDDDKDLWRKAIIEWQMPWIHLSDLKSWNSVAAGVYSVNSIPDNLLINPEGIVVARGLRGVALADKLAEVFG